MIKCYAEFIKALEEISLYFHSIEENRVDLSPEQEKLWLQITIYLESQK